MTIAVQNLSTLCTDAEVRKWATACGTQIRMHAASAWSRPSVPVMFLTRTQNVPLNAWPVYVLDDPDQQGALGYHDLDNRDRPYARVFARPSLDNDVSVSSVLSHELLEAFIDPGVQMWAENLDTGRLVALEVGDPVESDSYRMSDGTEVSNFVLPAWFDAASRGPYDRMGRVHAPFAMSAGGYEIVMHGGQVSQTFGDNPPPDWRRALKHAPGSRTSRRSRG